jgi:hypothetical protein|tara:strand:- start:256 stop:507 length:252 start_codon:yes stop_codon:yes gene_type:complete
MWNRFWDWYSKQLKGSLIFLLVIHIIQIPHMVWNADMYFEMGNIARVNPVLDFLLYGVDLIELISLVQVISLIYAHGIRHKLS